MRNIKILNFGKNCLIFKITVCLYSCHNGNVKQFDHTFSEFQDTHALTVKLDTFLNIDSSIGGSNLLLTDHSIIVANRGNLQKNHLFYQYSLETKEYMNKFIEWGTKKGMTYSPMSVGINSNEIWAHDLTLNKVLSFPLEKLNENNDDLESIKEFAIPGFAYSTRMLDGNMLMLSGFPHNPYLLEVLNLISGEPVKQIGSFIPPNNSLPLNTWKAAYESFLFVKPDETKAILAGRYTDNLKIFDLKTDTFISISGPENFDPIIHPLNNPKTDFYSISFTDNTRFAFIGGYVTDNLIYLLFSGKTMDQPNFNLSDEIHVFDWNGIPLKKINLNTFIKSIAVSQGDSILYAIDPINSFIYKSTNFH